MKNSISEADAVITINSDQENDWQKAELQIAEELSKTIIPMNDILAEEEEKSVFKSKVYSDSDYGENLKIFGKSD